MLQFLILCCAVVHASSQCIYNKTNLVDVGDSSNGVYNVHFQNAVGGTFTYHDQPSCYQNEPMLVFPGVLRLWTGSIVVKQAMDLVGNSEVYLTLTTDSWLVGTICKQGQSTSPLIPDSACKMAFCENATSLCTLLGTPGTHTLGEVEGDLGIDSRIELPPLGALLNGIVEGKWQVTLDVHYEGKIVASLHIPTNEKFIEIQANF